MVNIVQKAVTIRFFGQLLGVFLICLPAAGDVLPTAEYLDIVEWRFAAPSLPAAENLSLSLVAQDNRELSLELKGTASPGTEIKGDTGETIRKEDGSFTLRLPVQRGLQGSVIQVRDSAGTVQAIPLTLVLKKMPPGWFLRVRDGEKISTTNLQFGGSVSPALHLQVFSSEKPSVEISAGDCARATVEILGRSLAPGETAVLRFHPPSGAAVVDVPVDPGTRSVALPEGACRPGKQLYQLIRSGTSSEPLSETNVLQVSPAEELELSTRLGVMFVEFLRAAGLDGNFSQAVLQQEVIQRRGSWDFEARGELGLFSLGTLDDISTPRWLSLGADARYRWLRGPKLMLSGGPGIGYQHFFGSESSVGYSHLVTPQLSSKMEYACESKWKATLSLSLGPSWLRDHGLGLSSWQWRACTGVEHPREAAAGISYLATLCYLSQSFPDTLPLRGARFWSVSAGVQF